MKITKAQRLLLIELKKNKGSLVPYLSLSNRKIFRLRDENVSPIRNVSIRMAALLYKKGALKKNDNGFLVLAPENLTRNKL